MKYNQTVLKKEGMPVVEFRRSSCATRTRRSSRTSLVWRGGHIPDQRLRYMVDEQPCPKESMLLPVFRSSA